MKEATHGVPRGNAPQLLVVIPCHNEQGRVNSVIRSVRSSVPSADIAVVDDASSDLTGAEARAEGAVVLRHEVNLGYGAALETGYSYALQKDYDVVLQMDGDGQHRAEDLKLLLEPLHAGTADLVLGSRHRAGSDTSTPLIRRLGQRIFSSIIYVLSGRSFSDPTSGFQALNRRTLNLFASGCFPCDYPDSDVILMSLMAGLRIKEVPVTMKGREGGQSMHSGWKPLYYGMKMLLSILIVLLNYRVWRRWWKRHPVSGCSLKGD